MTLGILASGELGATILHQLMELYPIQFICTDSLSQSIISLAKKNEIPLFKGNPRKNDAINDFLATVPCDVLISINYLFLIDKNLIHHPKKVAFNVHGSLLPKYRGRTPHVWSIINGEQETGITAHLIDEGCDTGAIIEQVRIPIEERNTGADLLEKYKLLYFPLIQRVLNQLEQFGKLNTTPQLEADASYFGKRTPDDGEIDWNWDCKRIYNWVRAQADPYPGAFTFYHGERIIIDFVDIVTTTDVDSSIPNGTIIQLNPLRIKANDGVVEVSKLRTKNPTFEVGKKMHHENR